jgi:hypothetical protein
LSIRREPFAPVDINEQIAALDIIIASQSVPVGPYVIGETTDNVVV